MVLRLAGWLGAALVGWLVGSVLMGSLLTAAMPSFVPPPAPGVTPVTLTTSDGVRLEGWYQAPDGAAATAAVLLLHGNGGNRAQMWPRAQMLREAGYAVFAIDFRGQGQSERVATTVGWRERLDVMAAERWLRARHPGLPVAIVGLSLGGAATLMAAEDVKPDILVLELVYPDLKRALCNRFDAAFGWFPCSLTPAVTWQLPLRWGIREAELSPVRQARLVSAPVLVIGGERDAYTPPAESRELAAAFAPPAALWLLPSLGHGDPFAAAPEEYRQRVTAFLASALEERGA
jgi:dipeptidyl aminopeptidase/acylaminoacyl peptidase